MRLEADGIHFSYRDKNILQDIGLTIQKGEFVGIIGPNGSGKSTFLRNLYGVLRPDKGTAAIDDENLYRIPPKKLATKIAVVGQENFVPFDFKVEEIVAMGRHPHKKLLEGDTPEDREIIRNALQLLHIEDFAKREYRSLSGGEKQRVLIARALAQKTDFLILDEPTNHLDIRYQLQIFELAKTLDLTILAAIHDLNMAALYCHRLYVLKSGKVYHTGTAEETLTPEILHAVYGIHVDVRTHPLTQKLTITYLPTL